MDLSDKSIINYTDLELTPTHCGYCGGYRSLSQGVIFDQLSVEDYQVLLDRGWRRSGRYVYKPKMDQTCCPLYTIRCDVEKFQPSHSQRKTIRQVMNFIYKDEPKSENSKPKDFSKCSKSSDTQPPQNESKQKSEFSEQIVQPETKKSSKILKKDRKENFINKQALKGKELTFKSLEKNSPKRLQDLVKTTNLNKINEKILQSDENSIHKLELRLVKADLSDEEFMETIAESYSVYKKYQVQIHKDEESDCDIQTYAGFLCDSPLRYKTVNDVTFGSFHQQYLVDDRIVCVAVLDILPGCLSSVYLYYDPDWWGQKPNLSPGTFSALKEIQFTQQCKIPYYYMGYYIHSIPKMRYKGKFLPSDLLSPSLLSWHDIENCIPELEKLKYSTFESVPTSQPQLKEDDKEEKDILILNGNSLSMLNDKEQKKLPERRYNILQEYKNLVGSSMAKKLVLKLDWLGNYP